MYIARVFQVMIGSPGDATDERGIAEREISQWNATNSYGKKTILKPLMWEYSGTRRIRRGGDAQAELNWMVDQADVMFAFFNLRTGTPTPRATSGTVEEIDRAIDKDIPVHLYMSKADIPRDTPQQQLDDLKAMESKYKPMGLVGYFKAFDELGSMLRNDIAGDIDELSQFSAPVNSQAEDLVVKLVTPRSKPTVRITNGGTRSISDLNVTLATKAGKNVPLLLGERFRLDPAAARALPIVTPGSYSPSNLVLNVSWLNGKVVEHATLPVS
jgi:hypothetical protein